MSPLAIGQVKGGRSKSHLGPLSADSRFSGIGGPPPLPIGGPGFLEAIEARRPSSAKTTLQERRGLELSPLALGKGGKGESGSGSGSGNGRESFKLGRSRSRGSRGERAERGEDGEEGSFSDSPGKREKERYRVQVGEE